MEEEIKLLLNNKLNYLNGLLADAKHVGNISEVLRL